MTNLKNLFLAAVTGGLIAAIAVVSLSRLPSRVISDARDTNLSQSPVASGIVAFDVSDVVERANPAVVSIVISQEVPIVEQYFDDDPFGDIFGGNPPFQFRIPRYRQNGTQEREVGGGSGFLVSADGYVVTNAHVVAQDEATYTVLLNDEREFDANIIARDTMLDIALLKIDTDALPYLSFGDSDALKLGQAVIAIGNALSEFRNSVSTGVVSGLSRSIVAGGGGQNELLENVIQTDAAINPGNSGGPLLNLRGEVIGINVAVARGSENIGFALPANLVRASVESMREHGRVVRPFMGVRYRLVTPALASANNLSVDHGAIVLRGENSDELAVLPGSPADKAGIEENDILFEIDGVAIDERHSPASLIRRKSVGDTIRVRLLHDEKERTLDIVLEEAPA